MSFKIKITRNFDKEAKPLLKKYPSFKTDIARLMGQLVINPDQGQRLGQNLYKVRLAITARNSGKSGGARVITYVIFDNETVYMVSIYDKAEYDTADINILLKILRDEGL